MTNHLETMRRLARSVADRTAGEIALGMFRLYLVAAGATVSGSLIYIPGRATPLRGWKAAGEWVVALPDTSGFLRDLANAHDTAEREVRGVPQAPATVDELSRVAEAVADLAKQITGLAAAPKPNPGSLIVRPDASLWSLLAADDVLMGRIIKRAQYEALKTVLAVLDGWIEGARQNAEAGLGTLADAERFHADDIRNMINDTARELEVREPWRKAAVDA